MSSNNSNTDTDYKVVLAAYQLMGDDVPRLTTDIRGTIIKLTAGLAFIESLERRFDRALLRERIAALSALHQATNTDTLGNFWPMTPPASVTPPSSDVLPSPTPPPSPTDAAFSDGIGLTPAPRHLLSKSERSALIKKRSMQELGRELPEIPQKLVTADPKFEHLGFMLEY